MLRLDSDRPVEFCDGSRRRDFLHAGALSLLGLGLNDLFAMKALGAVDKKKDTNCIMLFLVGGPSQLDTWDMKPNAPVEIRGPYKPIKTNVPGIEISENFPRMAKHADKYALIRSVYHTAAAVHDTGHQMMQTGRLFQGGVEYPHIGCVLSKLKGPNGDVPPHVLRSEEHTSELQSPCNIVCRLLLEKTKESTDPLAASTMRSSTRENLSTQQNDEISYESCPAVLIRRSIAIAVRRNCRAEVRR